MSPSTDELAAVASEAAQAPGDYLRATFRDGHVDGEYDSLDVKAVADRQAQTRIQGVIEAHYPNHAFDGEESDDIADSPYRWVVDPLDGTNNFASGYPKFATAVAVLEGDKPVAAAISEPLIESVYVARRNGGATLDGESLAAERNLPLEHGTVALVVGLSAVTDPTLSDQIERLEGELRAHCKRVVATWAPCVDWGLLAQGSIEAIVCFHPDRYEHHAGSLLAGESGIEAVDTRAENGVYVAAPDHTTAVRLGEIAEHTQS